MTTQPAQEEGEYHMPVLLREAVEGLAVRENGVYADCTFGGGGHSREILKNLGKEGKLFVFDQDAAAKVNLPQGDDRVVFIQQNFRHLSRFLKLHGVEKLDGILADLGVSSHQFDEAERGFSTRFDGPMDMRMDKRQPRTAAMVLKEMPAAELHKMFEIYGEVTNSKTLANTIAAQRGLNAVETIKQFKQAVQAVVKGNPNKYFAQVFQALRIEVNDELGALKEMLEQAPGLLKAGGRLVIISFHSLEDRLVKNFLKYNNFSGEVVTDAFGHSPEKQWNIITKKPITAGPPEMKKNSRSRSAKLRIGERK
ncbi:MAG: 16S rRNA (cytosine(1402)-N(4))-methyltransferase RsmH [Ferruginibacter sp.]